MSGIFVKLLVASQVALVAAVPMAADARELVLSIGGEPDLGFDPLYGWGLYGHPLFQSTLLSRDSDLNIKSDLALDWQLSDNRLVWTITLRDDALFSDGSKLSAEDVAFTFNSAAKADSMVDLTVFDRAEVVDATTVIIHLKKPWITFMETFFTLGIVPEKQYSEAYSRNPVGSGPYRMVSWTQGEQLIVEKNPHYYGQGSEFERLVFVFNDEDTGYAAARAGKLDMVAAPAQLGNSVPDGYKRVIAQSVDNRGMAFPLQAAGEKTADGLALGNDVTSDKAIRQAINLGVDRQVLVDVALHGFGRPAWGPADSLPWSNTEAAVEYDPVAAKVLLDEAGWIAGSDGVRVKDGVRASFPLNYPASDSTRQAIALTTAELLRDIGLDVTATGLTWDMIGRVAYSEPVLYGWGSHSPLEVYNLYHSSSAGVGNQNVGYLRNQTIDDYLEKAQQAVSFEESYPLWQKAEWDGTTGFSAQGEAAWAWLVNLDHVYFVSDCLDLGALQIEPHGHGWPITAGLQHWQWTCE